ncbi:MAG TPA: FIST N-terminal domain-containing protein [Acidimicrobiales bacterium]|nr:FIST N-terminal domain-containing protein [Acidimicrobiales bacterium]
MRATSRGQSVASDPRQAVTEFHAAVARPDASLVMFFCSPEYEFDVVADEMRRQFQEVDVVGCTTAGEIGPSGYLEHSLSGVSFSKQDFSVAPAGLDDLINRRSVDSQTPQFLGVETGLRQLKDSPTATEG